MAKKIVTVRVRHGEHVPKIQGYKLNFVWVSRGKKQTVQPY